MYTYFSQLEPCGSEDIRLAIRSENIDIFYLSFTKRTYRTLTPWERIAGRDERWTDALLPVGKTCEYRFLDAAHICRRTAFRICRTAPAFSLARHSGWQPVATKVLGFKSIGSTVIGRQYLDGEHGELVMHKPDRMNESWNAALPPLFAGSSLHVRAEKATGPLSNPTAIRIHHPVFRQLIGAFSAVSTSVFAITYSLV